MTYRAAFRRHSRQRQSSSSAGIGSRAVSSAHQQAPNRPQENSTPQRGQARRRVTGFGLSNRLVMTAIVQFLGVSSLPGVVFNRLASLTISSSDGLRFARSMPEM